MSWEDDLIMTNVRSFDVKAYDNAFAGYADLGWADDLRLWLPYRGWRLHQPDCAAGHFSQTPAAGRSGRPLLAAGRRSGYNPVTQTLAHEGRMPPLTTDLVLTPSSARWGRPPSTSVFPAPSPRQRCLTANKGNYNDGNVGDDTAGVVRLRRVWDSWSTD